MLFRKIMSREVAGKKLIDDICYIAISAWQMVPSVEYINGIINGSGYHELYHSLASCPTREYNPEQAFATEDKAEEYMLKQLDKIKQSSSFIRLQEFHESCEEKIEVRKTCLPKNAYWILIMACKKEVANELVANLIKRKTDNVESDVEGTEALLFQGHALFQKHILSARNVDNSQVVTRQREDKEHIHRISKSMRS